MELFSREFGQGKPLIILHGLFGSSDNWATIGRKLSEKRKVFLVDQRNHGRSFHSADFNHQALAEDIRTFIESKGLNQVDVLGHSLGGKAAMAFGLKHDHLLRNLIVVDIAPKSYPVHHKELVDAMLGLNLDSLVDRKQADEELAQSVKEPGLRQFLLKNLAKNEDGDFFWRLNLPVIGNRMETIGEEVKADRPISNDTLFIRGLRSNYVSMPEDLGLIRTLFANYQMKEVDAGHWLHSEKPVEFLEIVEDFLGQASPDAEERR
jgi:esterase